MDLSIIIPVWNEESKIATDIGNINAYFEKSSLQIELIIVDDGSTDRSTQIAEEKSKNISLNTRIITCMHKGKGHAVRKGMTASCGRIAMYMDCGSNVPLNFIDKGMAFIENDQAHVVLGSRYNPASKITYDMIWFRKLSSAAFRSFIKLFLDIPKEISDTQCGFKLFNGDVARDIFAEIKTNGFLFDLEVILIAIAKKYLLKELPLQWQCDRDSRLSIVRSLFSVLKELHYLRKI